MKYELDVHTHTLASGHAYNTIAEMAKIASKKGLKLLGITEHAPKMPGTCHEFYFQNLGCVNREMFGVELLLGAELNIISYDGAVDLPEDTLKRLDILVASLHTPCIKPGSKADNTDAILGVMDNPYINIIGHPDDGRFPIDYEAMVKKAKEKKVLIEINNNSLNPNGFRLNARENDIKILELCKKYQTPIVIDSDAHSCDIIANHQNVDSLLELVDFPEKLIMNCSAKDFKKYIKNKTG